LESLRAKRCLKQQSTDAPSAPFSNVSFKDFSFQSWKPFRLFDGGHTPWYSLMRHMVKQLGLWHGQRNPLAKQVEKAHPDVFNVLLQLLDDGRSLKLRVCLVNVAGEMCLIDLYARLTDSKGRVVSFANTMAS